MTKVCSVCGDEVKGGFFSSIDRCQKCGKYVCDDCSRDNGDSIYCPDCFEKIRD
ncbi:MAG: hypothetical protein AABY15_00005 [Nanoarchaeota archaeon]